MVLKKRNFSTSKLSLSSSPSNVFYSIHIKINLLRASAQNTYTFYLLLLLGNAVDFLECHVVLFWAKWGTYKNLMEALKQKSREISLGNLQFIYFLWKNNANSGQMLSQIEFQISNDIFASLTPATDLCLMGQWQNE
jgi:hypothetical protein